MTWQDSQGEILKGLRYGGPFMARCFVRGGFAKGIHKFAFQLKAEVRLTQLQSIKRVKIDWMSLKIQLDQRNLESLVHVCGELIPGGQRERITSGWEVFSILLRQNAIGEEPRKMAFLLGIIKELRPKRRDLVGMVKRYIEEHYEQPEEILTDFESSSDGYRGSGRVFRDSGFDQNTVRESGKR